MSLINHEPVIFQNSNSRQIRPFKLDGFSQYMKTLNSRLSDLYQEASEDSFIPASLLPKTFKELGTVSEELQVALEELLEQQDELLLTRHALEAECQRYENLFNLAPDAYIVTDHLGIIREANRAVGHLFNLSPEFLVGKPFANFVFLEDRRKFRTELSLCQEHHFIKDFEVRMQPRHGEVFPATLRVSSLRNGSVEPMELRFCVRNNVLSHRVTSSHGNGNGSTTAGLSSELSESQRSLHFFSKGEIVPLNPQAVWLVLEGVVKLSTMNDSGEEVIMGLATSQMPFGPSLTSLEIYEATAVSERVELMSVALAEISSTAALSHLFVSHLKQRVRQAEAFLSIYGRRRVKDRLVQLLKLLKQEIGEVTPTGTRLKIRLTHQELADACCTTRVTITRLINQLQKQQKVIVDPQNHLIICQDDF